jgi:hypothetical protein
MKKAFTITIVLMLLSVSVVMAAETDTSVNLKEVDYKTVVIQENAKTQAYIKQELAKRDADMEKKIYKYVDDNFGVLDERIDGFIRKATFKLGMVFLSGMVLGGSILLLINKGLRKKRIGRKNLTPEETKGETTVTTLPKETLDKMRLLSRGETPRQEILEQIKDLREELDSISTQNAGVNNYFRLTGDTK